MPNLLHLVHRLPYPPDKGDRIRSFHLLRFLARYAKVSLACLADEPVSDEALAVLRSFCERVAVVPLSFPRWGRAALALASRRTVTEGAFQSAALEKTLAEWSGQVRFDAVLASASSMVPYLNLPCLRGVPAVVDLVDVDSQKWLDYADSTHGWRSWLYHMEGTRLRRLEANLPARFHAVTLVSTAEAELYRRFCAPGRVEAVPNGVDLEYFQPARSDEERSCVFVGALDYHPNVDGLTWFCREIWPGINRQRPETKLYLVGRKPTPAVMQLAPLPGVRLIGQVPDVRPFVEQAAVVVVPLRLARGLQNKVLEALAMGKATVASPPALAALGVTPGEHLLSAASVPEWETAIGRLLDDDSLRQQLGTAGRRYVEAHHSWERCLEPMASLLGLKSPDQ
jgi:sugar transferase (PEP-CTERM/EpsH1 system associated)